MHFIGKELVEDRPALFPLHRAAAGPVAKAVEEIVPFQLEIDVVRFARTAVKGGDEMQQHLVAVCNQERPVHATADRQSVVEGKSGAVSVGPGGRSIINKKITKRHPSRTKQ